MRLLKAALRRIVGFPAYQAAHDWKVRVRHGYRLIAGLDPLLSVSMEARVEKHGDWYLCPDVLTSTSIIYSLGVGEDIAFDLSVIERFGAHVFAFDPTPRALSWIQRQVVPDKFHFLPLGAAAFDGIAEFSLPDEPDNASFGYGLHDGDLSRAVRCPVRRLGTLMSNFDHSEIDLLKMDIEGAEYEVIEDLIQQAIPVKQLIVEFHHRKPAVGAQRTRDAVRKLEANGFRLFHISPSGMEFAFIK